MTKLYVFIDNDGDLTAFNQRNPTVGAHHVSYSGLKSVDIADRLDDFAKSWDARTTLMFRTGPISATGICEFTAAEPRYVGSINVPA